MLTILYPFPNWNLEYTQLLIEKYLKSMKSTRFIHRVRANALSIPDGSPLYPPRRWQWLESCREIFSRAPSFSRQSFQTRVLGTGEGAKKKEEGGRKEETALVADSHREIRVLDTSPPPSLLPFKIITFCSRWSMPGFRVRTAGIR